MITDYKQWLQDMTNTKLVDTSVESINTKDNNSTYSSIIKKELFSPLSNVRNFL
jgi:hypothetical protein